VRFADVVRLQEELGCSETLAWILVRRGLGDPRAARTFLDAGGVAAPLAPPESTPGIAHAADRLVDALRRRERIVVHGDYDCDGIASTAILVEALRARGARVRAFLPSRFTDGYGVSESTVERLADEGCDVLVCVDCGTTAVGPLARASELGIAPIVCDHHLAGGVRPVGIVANPALGRGREDLPAAAGVVFDLVRALASRLDGDRLAPAAEDGIDLVALATVADAVPLVGQNRQLVARGLAAMRTSTRPGIAALCRAAGIATRALDARQLGFTIAPCLNAAGRMAHPEQGLDLLLERDPERVDSLAAALWQLNLDRRDVERGIVAEAVSMVEAAPEDERGRDALVVAGDGWHEGVVGIVASRLVERFGRPAVVLTRDGDRAKGSGRSLPGVDLHGLVAAASARLIRWGGHQGAVGLELRCEDVAHFREGLARAAAGVRGAIERARVRVIDAVVSPREITLPVAEEIQRLAPFGRGNPEVRLALPGCQIVRTARVGEDGRHLEVRLRASGAHVRAIGFGMGERQEGIDAESRHDALVRLEVERYQELVGPRATLEALEPVGSAAPPDGLCRQPCDAACADRAAVTRNLLDAPDDLPEAPSGAPAAVRDRRGSGAGVPLLASLAHADGGAVAVVSDVARRRGALEAVLEPRRLGIEVAVIVGRRCSVDAARHRLAGARGVPLLAMVEYESLPDVDLPPGAHVVLVDPPAHASEAAWTLLRADRRTLHLAWGEDEVDFARQVAEERYELRPMAAEIWRALRDGARRGWGGGLDRLLLGEGSVMRPAVAAGRALSALREIGLIEVDGSGVRAVLDAPRRDLGESGRYRAAQARLEECRAFLSTAMTLDMSPERSAAAVAAHA
jgi:single-stranded-DNA-specific exonuclease